jgi:Leucine-rich repeat (LRR) protein
MEAFQSQRSLESLDLSHNLIATLDAHSLAGLSHLRHLYLAHNRLTRFNSDVFHGKTPRAISRWNGTGGKVYAILTVH